VLDALPASQALELGSELDDLGYGSLWFGEAYGGESLTTATMLAGANQESREALRRAHEHLDIYTGLPNYRNNWLREGFSDDDLVRGGSDKLAHALVAIGDEGAITKKVNDHLDAGADHVCLQVLGANLAEPPLAEWRSLARALAEVKP
jgi:alkanesulfonate monooxygenase SsuD/methylene tetrahydromethanopterin reductase-like flavin-dependent oxidoreductase (luciferase family)